MILYCRLPKFQVKKPCPHLWVPNKCTGPSTFGGNFDDNEVTLNQQRIFLCAPKLFHAKFHQIMSPPCAHTSGYLSVPPSELPGMRSLNQLLHKSQYSFLFLPKSPLVSQRWPILPLPQLIERTHARIAQPHEILNLSQV